MKMDLFIQQCKENFLDLLLFLIRSLIIIFILFFIFIMIKEYFKSSPDLNNNDTTCNKNNNQTSININNNHINKTKKKNIKKKKIEQVSILKGKDFITDKHIEAQEYYNYKREQFIKQKKYNKTMSLSQFFDNINNKNRNIIQNINNNKNHNHIDSKKQQYNEDILSNLNVKNNSNDNDHNNNDYKDNNNIFDEQLNKLNLHSDQKINKNLNLNPELLNEIFKDFDIISKEDNNVLNEILTEDEEKFSECNDTENNVDDFFDNIFVKDKDKKINDVLKTIIEIDNKLSVDKVIYNLRRGISCVKRNILSLYKTENYNNDIIEKEVNCLIFSNINNLEKQCKQETKKLIKNKEEQIKLKKYICNKRSVEILNNIISNACNISFIKSEFVDGIVDNAYGIIIENIYKKKNIDKIESKSDNEIDYKTDQENNINSYNYKNE
jgi:hypothetical protein